MSSSSSRTAMLGVIAIEARGIHPPQSVTHSILRRTSCTASSCLRRGSLSSSRSPMTDTQGRLPVRRERTISARSRRCLSLALLRSALVRAGGRGGRKAQESGGETFSIRCGSGCFAANMPTCELLYSRSCRTALSPPAFEQCPLLLWVRADRPTSAIDRSAHEDAFERPSLEFRSRHASDRSRCWWREAEARRLPVPLAGATAYPFAAGKLCAA
jgi:hypothetical protein